MDFIYKTEDTSAFNTYEIMTKVKDKSKKESYNYISQFKVSFDKKLCQIIISTPNEVYQGPIDFIKLSADITDNKK